MPCAREAGRLATVRVVQRYHADVNAASRLVGKSKRYVQKCWNAYSSTGSVAEAARSGRPCVMSKDMERKVRILAINRQHSSSRRIAARLRHCMVPSKAPSVSTVLRALHKGRKKPVYGSSCGREKWPPRVMRERLAFCMRHKNTDWEEVVALDSKIFTLDNSGQAKVWHYADQVPDVPAMRDRRQVHVYGAACVKGVGKLFEVTGTTGHTMKYYSKRGTRLRGVGHREFIHVLWNEIIPTARKLYKSKPFKLLMDRAPAHTAFQVGQYMEHTYVQAIEDWPRNAPELNWVENLWGYMAHQVAGIQFKSVSALKRRLFGEWRSIPISLVENCVASMPTRIQICIARNDGHTGY